MLRDEQQPRSVRALSRWLPIALICALAVLLLWKSVLGGIFLPLDIVPHMHPWRFSYERVPVNNQRNSDVVLQVYPRRVVTNAIVRQGAFPLWNPTILTGTPLLADGQMTFFYPPSFLFMLLPLEHAFGYYALLHTILAGVGTYLFARRLSLDRVPATLAGICYMFSGYLLTWLQFPHHTGATAMLPWCFWAVARACERGAWSAWMLAGVALAMPLLTHIQVAFYVYTGVGCYVLVKIAQAGAWRRAARLAAGFSLALAVALSLSAAQLLPQIALSAEGQRAEQAVERESTGSQFTELLRLILPMTGGERRPAPSTWGPDLFQPLQPYAGLAPLVLAVAALLWSRRAATTLFGALAVGSFALAMQSPLLQLLLVVAPPYRQFGDHRRWFVLWGFALAVLAGLGLEALLRRSRPAGRSGRQVLLVNRLLLGAVTLFLAVWGGRHLALWTPASRYGEYITLIRQQSLLGPALIGGATLLVLGILLVRRVPLALRSSLLLLVVAGDLLWYGAGYNTTADPSLFQPTADLVAALPADATQGAASQALYRPTRQVEFLLRQPGPFRIHGGDYPVFLPNFPSAFGLEDIRGYQSLYFARYNRLVRLIDGKDYTQLASEGPASYKPYLTTAYRQRRLLNMLNVQFILFPPGSENPALYDPLELVQENDEGSIYRNPQALPRAWLVHQAEVVADDMDQLARLAEPDFNPAASVVLPEAPPDLALPTSAEATPSVEYAPNRLQVRAEAKAPALLVVSDAYSDDWRVTVDGRPATLYRANYAIRGVWLPAGQHEVVFSYRPRSFLIGGALSLVTLLGLAGYGLWRLCTGRGDGDSVAPGHRRPARADYAAGPRS